MKKLSVSDVEISIPMFDNVHSTEDVDESTGFVGQSKAYEALKTALEIEHKGYHAYVSGPVGTGRRTFIRMMAREYARRYPTPPDLVYVNNFENMWEPIFMKLSAGQGMELKQDMDRLVQEALEAIRKTFESDEYTKRRSELENEYLEEKNRLWEDLREKARELSFDVQITPTGIVTVPMIEGKPVAPEVFEQLPKDMKEKIRENSTKLKVLLEGALAKSRYLDRKLKESLNDLDRYVAMFAIGAIFDELKGKYHNNSDVKDFLEAVKSDMLKNLDKLRSEDGETLEFLKRRYGVNVLVDNSGQQGAPIVEEDHPTYANLLGKVEYYARQGLLHTDYSMIRAGAVHRANGGFLIIDALELISRPFAWEGLKRVLNAQQVKIENLESSLGFSNLHTLKPQPIPVKLKVILVGPEWVYSYLYTVDEDFRKLFGIKVPFDWVMDLNKENVRGFMAAMCTIVKENSLLHFRKDAVEEVIKYSLKLSGDRRKLSTRFSMIQRLMIEASHLAKEEGKSMVEVQHVKKAREMYENRVNLYREKLDEALVRGELMVDTSGRRVGQINGLTVMELGDYSFGVPVRITAKTYLGKPGVIDIQREADLSGKIHSKAVMILESYLNWKYGRWAPISLTASLSFEQVYSVVEGDSASLAETLALLSAVSGVPVRQDIAVTGSINQHGEVQPVGGIPEKIEGFFRLCFARGLTGKQGVIIPSRNVDHLVLNDDVMEAIRKGKFHIWTVDNVDEAAEIVMERRAGNELKRGGFTKDSINDLVYKALRKAKKFEESEAARKPSKRKRKRG